MPIHQLKLLNRTTVANSTIICEFEKPAGFTFIPGQYGGFTIITPVTTDTNGNTRRFSLLSTPEDNVIRIITRIQHSAFKKNLNTLAIGTEVKFGGPSGNFVLHEDINQPAVFIAGGMGIAPFYSIIRHTYLQESARKIILFYGNQCKKSAALLDELTEISQQHKAFTFIPVMAEDPNWDGETGYITHTLIKKYIPDIQQPVYYVCGGPAMVSTLQETLIELDIPAEQIKVEDFPGY